MPCSYSDASMPKLPRVSPFAYSAILELRHTLQNSLCTALTINSHIRNTNQWFRLLTSQIQRETEIYTYIDTIKLKAIHRLNAYLCEANSLGSSLCILLWELLDLPGTRIKVYPGSLGTPGRLESACCCQTSAREGELPGWAQGSSGSFWWSWSAVLDPACLEPLWQLSILRTVKHI